jgi:hypothetical protein
MTFLKSLLSWLNALKMEDPQETWFYNDLWW